MEYRPLPDDRRDEFEKYLQYAFSPEEGPGVDRGDDHDSDEQPGHPRALVDGDDLLAVCRHYWFRTRLRGRWFEMPGLAAVATPPEHRRNGYVTRLLAESLAEYRDRGDVLTALWATEHTVYGGLGWGLANRFGKYQCDPDDLAFARDCEEAGGEFRSLDTDDYDRLDPVLAAESAGYELAVDRSEDWWCERVLENWQAKPYVAGWADDGEIRGYLVYRFEAEDDGKRLHVEEFAAVDREARLNLLRYLANHDSQVDSVSVYAPPDWGLFDAVEDPGSVECEVKAGPMVRLVDVPAAIEAFDYPDVASRAFTLSVSDPLADWNDRTFRVDLADGRATCEPTDEEAETDTADASTSVSTLSQVVVGHHSVADAEQFGDLEVRDASARDGLTAMFPERDVFLREGF
ncbi:GNAT family N-acetyltransferase [Halorussus litoreus]|uniref:GNAT family N-acetyltransferase n=1 Tax=Halorussus litoreus TaxID=1710536 RepID=UPI000E263479|nr:GNAT family N-acetyltransferase [Halorussus litoreus]